MKPTLQAGLRHQFRYTVAENKTVPHLYPESESFQQMPHPMVKKDAVGANATAKVKRSDFNMGKYAPHVGDEVTIDIAVEAIKQ